VRREAKSILAGVSPHDTILLCDFGAIRGEDAGLGRVQLLAQAVRDPSEHVVVGMTPRSVVLVPVSVQRGLFRDRLRPLGVEILARSEVIMEVGPVDTRGSRRFVPVRFVRRDGSACLVELYGTPEAWALLPR
jgi:hypothetical protein